MIDKIIKALKKYKEIILYLFFGTATTIVSFGSYAMFVTAADMPITAGNTLSWVCAVIFAFITNKLWVFESKSLKAGVVATEFVSFVGSRLLTGIIEILGVPLLVRIGLSQTIFGVDGMLAKVLVSVIVVILNYVFSKLLVFRNEEKRNK